jgi:hypothetical protein
MIQEFALAPAQPAGPRRYPPDAARAWNIEGVTVYEQLASA